MRLCLDELHLLREEGGKVDIVDVDLSNKPKFYLDMTNGRGVVPLIEFSETGELVSESLRINERLWEEYYSDDDSSSFSASAFDLAFSISLKTLMENLGLSSEYV